MPMVELATNLSAESLIRLFVTGVTDLIKSADASATVALVISGHQNNVAEFSKSLTDKRD